MNSPIRIFFAITPPKEQQKIIAHVLQQLQIKIPSDTVRWTPLNKLHITLHFLKAFDLKDLENLSKKVEEQLKQFPPFEISVEGLELFPSGKHPKVISFNIPTREKNEILELAKVISNEIKNCGYPPEARPFRPHLTLARIQKPADVDNINIKHFQFIANEVILFESRPSIEGSQYIPLKKFSLK